MNKTVKSILTIVGIILIFYGIYTMIKPEASVSIGDFSIEAQDNTNSYITIGLGLISVLLGVLSSRR